MAAQQSFEDYLLQLQYEAQALHRQFEGTYDNARLILSQFLDTMNVNGLNISLTAVVYADSYRQDLYDYVATLTPSQCVNDVVTAFEETYASAGIQLSGCSYTAQETILGLTDRVHEVIDYGTVTSQETQNVVVSTISSWNPVVAVEELSYLVHKSLDESRAVLSSNVAELAVALDAVEEAVTGVPNAIYACSVPIIQRIFDASEDSKIKAWTC